MRRLVNNIHDQGGAEMDVKKFTINLLGLLFFFMVGLHCSPIYCAGNPSVGSTFPSFELKGPASPPTKSYLGVINEKLFPISQIKTKLVFVEFFDVY
jgi:hypothetical protein